MAQAVSSGPASSLMRRVFSPSVERGTTSPEVIDLTTDDSSSSVEVETVPRHPGRIGWGRGLLGRLAAAMDSASSSSEDTAFPRFFRSWSRPFGRISGYDLDFLDLRSGPSGYVAPASVADEVTVSPSQSRSSRFLASQAFVSPFASPRWSPPSSVSSSVAPSPTPEDDPQSGEENYNRRRHWSHWEVDIPSAVLASPFSKVDSHCFFRVLGF